MVVHFDGTHWYGDTALVTASQRLIPGSVLKHLGFGEFELELEDGKSTIQFDRMRGVPFEGMEGRSHRLYDNCGGEAVSVLVWAAKKEKTT